MVNKKEMALRGQTLFDKVETNYQIFNQELENVCVTWSNYLS